AVATVVLAFAASFASADPLTCNLAEYKATLGLTASCTTTELTLTWTGQQPDQLRMRLAIDGGTPTIAEIAIRKPGPSWVHRTSCQCPVTFPHVAGAIRMRTPS